MNLNRWMTSTRIAHAPEGDHGTAATAPAAPGGAGDGAAAVPDSVAAAAPATPPSALSAADSASRDGAPKGDTQAATESPAADGSGKEAPAKAGETPPPGGPEGKSDKDKTPEAADGKAKDAKPDETADGKPKEAEPAADKKDADAAEPPAPPAYDAYQVPENLKLDDTKLTEFNTILGKAELATKADPHAAMQALGQELVNFYGQEVARIGNEVMRYQVETWNRHCEQEFNALKNDPELGGNRINTTLGNAKYVLEQFGGSKEEQTRLMEKLDRSGISHSREFVALLHRMHERYREPEPVHPNLPSVKASQPGQRNWYE